MSIYTADFKEEVVRALTKMGYHPQDVLYDINEGDGELVAKLQARLSVSTVTSEVLDTVLWEISDELAVS